MFLPSWWTRGAAAATFGVLVLLGGTPRAAALDPYLIDGVRVDATARSAVEAREQALAEGQRRAFRRLMARLTLRADRARLPRLDDRRITDLVEEFQIRSEKVSAIRYLAELAYRFKPEETRALLRKAGVRFVEAVSKPVLVLPVYDGPDGLVLWDEPNPWRAAWTRLLPRNGLVPFVMALGDLQDFQIIDAQETAENDPAALAAITRRYGAAQALVAVASARPAPDGVDIDVEVSVRRFDLDTGSVIPLGQFKGPRGSGAESVFEATAEATAAEIEERWKLDNLVLSGPAGRLVVVVPIPDFEYWTEVRRRLAAVSLVQESRVLRLSRRRARVELSYVGDVGRLSSALAQGRLVLWREAAPASGDEASPAAPPTAAPAAPPTARAARPAAEQAWYLRLDGSAAAESPETPAEQ